jgi:hypothetical protein
VLEYVKRPGDVFYHQLVGPRVAEVLFIGEAPQAATQSDEDGVFGIVELVLGIIVEMGSIEPPVDREASADASWWQGLSLGSEVEPAARSLQSSLLCAS